MPDQGWLRLSAREAARQSAQIDLAEAARGKSGGAGGVTREEAQAAKQPRPPFG